MVYKFINLFLIVFILLIGCTPNSQPPTSTPKNGSQTNTSIPSEYNVATIGSEETPSPIVTQEIMLETPTTIPSELILPKGFLNLLSNPPGANVTIAEVDLTGNTPYSISLFPGVYTVRLTLENYQIWEEGITISSDQTLSISAQLVSIPQNVGQYIDLISLGGLGAPSELYYLREVTWEPTKQSFVYGIQKGLNLSEAKDWIWSSYNLLTHEIVEINPPTSSISAETRTALNLCPLAESEWTGSIKCSSLSVLFESPFHNFMAFSPIILDPYSEGQLRIAHANGSSAQQLADFAPSYVHWSINEQWLVTGWHFPGLPGQETHFLAATDGSFIQTLQHITGIDSFYLNGLFPQFSPTNSQLLIAGSEISESRDENDYNLYVLDLNTFEHRFVTKRVGLFQWADNGNGVYVLDGALDPIILSGVNIRKTALYYIDLTQSPPQEYLIAEEIPYHPQSDYGMWNWAYSPLFQAIAYVGFNDEPNLGVLFLESNE